MKIKMNESRVLEFQIDASNGCELEDLQGYLRFNLAGVEYGFPAKVEEGQFKVEVPAFQNVINTKLTESISKNKELIVKGRLDVIANKNTYVIPWQGDIDIEIPIEMNVSEGGTLDEKKEITVSDPDKGNLLDAFNEIFEEKKDKKLEESKLKEILKVDEAKYRMVWIDSDGKPFDSIDNVKASSSADAFEKAKMKKPPGAIKVDLVVNKKSIGKYDLSKKLLEKEDLGSKYKCKPCGWVYDPEKQGKPFSEWDGPCPECDAPKSKFEKVGEVKEEEKEKKSKFAQSLEKVT